MIAAYSPLLSFSPPVSSDVVRVETTTLLPGGALVVVAVRAVGGAYEVGDEACGRAALLALGVQDLSRGDTRRGRELAEAQGLSFDGQGFHLAGVDGDQLSAAIVYVADACQAWTRGAVEVRERRIERDLADLTLRRLVEALPGLKIDRDRELQGSSTKRHRFDIVAVLPGDRFAMFETTSPVSSSIAPTHLKFFDLSMAHADWPREAVVADFADWASPDLVLLSGVATHIRAASQPWRDLASLVA